MYPRTIVYKEKVDCLQTKTNQEMRSEGITPGVELEDCWAILCLEESGPTSHQIPFRQGVAIGL